MTMNSNRNIERHTFLASITEIVVVFYSAVHFIVTSL